MCVIEMQSDQQNPWNKLIDNETLLLEQLRVTEDVLLTLCRENLITTEELAHFRSIEDRSEKIRTLLFDVLQYQDPTFFPVFCDVLRRSNQDEIADRLDDDRAREERRDGVSVKFERRKRVHWNEEYLTRLARQIVVTFTLVLVFLIILVVLGVQP